MKRRIAMLARMLSRNGKKQVRGRSYRPQLEALEERALLSIDNWTGLGPDRNWSDPANWDNGVPNAGDDLQFISTFSGQPPVINDVSPGMTIHSLFFSFGQPTYVDSGE